MYTRGNGTLASLCWYAQGATWTDVRIPLGKAATAAKTWLIEPTVVEVCKPQGYALCCACCVVVFCWG